MKEIESSCAVGQDSFDGSPNKYWPDLKINSSYICGEKKNLNKEKSQWDLLFGQAGRARWSFLLKSYGFMWGVRLLESPGKVFGLGRTTERDRKQ